MVHESQGYGLETIPTHCQPCGLVPAYSQLGQKEPEVGSERKFLAVVLTLESVLQGASLRRSSSLDCLVTLIKLVLERVSYTYFFSSEQKKRPPFLRHVRTIYACAR